MGRKALILATLVALLVVVLAVPGVAAAQEIGKRFTLGPVQVVVLAPKLIWEGTNAHVIIKATNTTSEPVDVAATFALPKGAEKRFDYKGKPEASVSGIKPGETKYMAFTYIKPKKGGDLGQFTSDISVKVGGAEARVPWVFDLREGSRFRAQTNSIVYTIMAVSIGMVIFWFIYFKIVNPSFRIIQ